MKKCIKCTLTYDDDDKFICENCGMPLEEVVEAEDADVIEEDGLFQVAPDEKHQKVNSLMEKINGIKNKKLIALIAALVVGTLLSLFVSMVFVIILIASLVYIVKNYNDDKYKKTLYIANIVALGLCFGVGLVTFYLNNRKPYIGKFECASYSVSDKKKVGEYNTVLTFDKKEFSIVTGDVEVSGDYELTKKVEKNNGNDEYRMKLKVKKRVVNGETLKDEGTDEDNSFKFTFKKHGKKDEYLFINTSSYTTYICRPKK